MQAAHQDHRMKQAMVEMDSRKRVSCQGFREGGDSYYGKKGMLWWGAGVHVKSDTGGVYESDGSQDEKLHVVIHFTAKESQSQQHTMEL